MGKTTFDVAAEKAQHSKYESLLAKHQSLVDKMMVSDYNEDDSRELRNIEIQLQQLEGGKIVANEPINNF